MLAQGELNNLLRVLTSSLLWLPFDQGTHGRRLKLIAAGQYLRRPAHVILASYVCVNIMYLPVDSV